MTKLLLIDTETIRLWGMRKALEDDVSLNVLGEAKTGEGAIKLVKQLQPDCVLLAFELNDMTGLEVCRRIVRESSKIKVIFLVEQLSPPLLARLCASEAMGVVPKYAYSSYKESISKVVNGERYIQSDITARLFEKMESIHMFSQLSELEFQVLYMVLNEWKIEHVARSVCKSERTVYKIISTIKEKLGQFDVARMLLQLNYGRHIDDNIFN